MIKILNIMRIPQYVKNLFIFLPLFFSLQINDLSLLTQVFIAFIAYSLTASAIYIFNDYIDIQEDKKHPTKRFRPLANGDISKKMAITLMALLSISGMLLMSALSLEATIILIIYIILNISYSLKLKHIAVLDVVTIASGFVLRLFVGATVANVDVSMWVTLITFFLALFLALAKRRDDVLIFLNTGKKMRKVIDGYSLPFLDTTISIMGAITIMSYTLYITSSDIIEKFNNQYLYLTTIFVVLGIMRYLQIMLIFLDSGSPTKIIFKDIFIQSTVIGWLLTLAWMIY